MSDITIKESRRRALAAGMHDGIPIGLGYFAVAFALGIAARSAGLNAVQSFIVSLFCNASAGEYAGFTLIASGAAYTELALMTLVANARYLLMSCALSQRAAGLNLLERLIIGVDVTDEIFAVTIARPGRLDPVRFYGTMLVAMPAWAFGTAFGNIAGDLLPARLVSALGVALYGMFLAVIIPPAKKDRLIAGLIVFCFAVSYAMARLPLTLSRKPIRSRFIRSFLFYVPYVTLAVMTFPAILDATSSPAAGLSALIVGILAAYFGMSLLQVAVTCCGVVLLAEWLLPLLGI